MDEKVNTSNSHFIIPAIDIMDGQCVRLSQGDFQQKKVYHQQPVEMAKLFEEAGIRRLHLVDLDGASSGSIRNLNVLEQLAANTSLKIDFGGGVKTRGDMQDVLNAGASLITVGSLAVKQPDYFMEMVSFFGAGKFFVGADVSREKLAIHGWQEQTDVSVFDFINGLIQAGIHHAFCTDIEKDGMMQGPAFALYQRILSQCPGIELVASGGITSLKDLMQLQKSGCSGAIVGKAIYEGTITLAEINAFIANG
jgi:phosphoribosylformimino-5-aminoimidazole carboxamide ribotide isomerase